MYAIYLTKVCDPEVGVLDTDTLIGTAEDLDGALSAGLEEVGATTPGYIRVLGVDPRVVVDYGSWSQFIRIINLEA